MKLNGIYIDYKNKEQLYWWNNVASKLVKVRHSNKVVETATGEIVGELLALQGVLKKYVINENKKFISNPKVMTIDIKD